jgi:isoleucyl-tRNA synthetase
MVVFAGPDLPKPTYAAAMVLTPDGTGVVHMGGEFTKKDFFELKCSESICNWSLMDQKLNVDRVYSVAMYVPDSFVDCVK